MSTTLVPIMICTGAFLLVAALRYMRHIERMNMIERGIQPDSINNQQKTSNPNSIAFMILGASIGLLAAILTTRGLQNSFSEEESTGVFFAFIGIGSAIGMLAARRFSR